MHTKNGAIKNMHYKTNKITLDFNDYPDINMEEFDSWFYEIFINKLKLAYQGEEVLNFFMGKYDLEWWFHRDMENNQFSIELILVDKTKE